jgi:putative acetyltransferase
VQLCDIYYNAIHNVNRRDYTSEELEAWAPSNAYNEESYANDTARWSKIMPFVVAEGDNALGFAEPEDGGNVNCFLCITSVKDGALAGCRWMRASVSQGSWGMRKLSPR